MLFLSAPAPIAPGQGSRPRLVVKALHLHDKRSPERSEPFTLPRPFILIGGCGETLLLPAPADAAKGCPPEALLIFAYPGHAAISPPSYFFAAAKIMACWPFAGISPCLRFSRARKKTLPSQHCVYTGCIY